MAVSRLFYQLLISAFLIFLFHSLAAHHAAAQSAKNEPTVSELIQQITDSTENRRARGVAASALIKKGDEAVESLVQVLEGPNEHARHYALHVLGQIKTPKALVALDEYERQQRRKEGELEE